VTHSAVSETSVKRADSRSRRPRHSLAVLGVALVLASAPVAAADCVFSQDSAFAIGEASSSSRLAVSGVGGPVTEVVVSLNDAGAPGGGEGGFSDLDLLLVSPAGDRVVLASFACLVTFELLDLVFDPTASTPIPSADGEDGDICLSGTYLPGDYNDLAGGYLLASPAPAPPYSVDLSDFTGDDPTGMWALWGASYRDESEGQVASWELRLTATSCGAPTLVFADDFEAGVCGWSLESGESPACP
jgi:hypothetical protein